MFQKGKLQRAGRHWWGRVGTRPAHSGPGSSRPPGLRFSREQPRPVTRAMSCVLGEIAAFGVRGMRRGGVFFLQKKPLQSGPAGGAHVLAGRFYRWHLWLCCRHTSRRLLRCWHSHGREGCPSVTSSRVSGPSEVHVHRGALPAPSGPWRPRCRCPADPQDPAQQPCSWASPVLCGAGAVGWVGSAPWPGGPGPAGAHGGTAVLCLARLPSQPSLSSPRAHSHHHRSVVPDATSPTFCSS